LLAEGNANQQLFAGQHVCFHGFILEWG
jgi:hypothetical protein